MSRGVSAEDSGDTSALPTPQLDNTVKHGLSPAELDNKILSILEEYLHICDIQVLFLLICNSRCLIFLCLAVEFVWMISSSLFIFLQAAAAVVLTCVSHTAHVIAIASPAYSTVRLSITRWYCVETAQHIVKLSSLPGSPMILVF